MCVGLALVGYDVTYEEDNGTSPCWESDGAMV